MCIHLHFGIPWRNQRDPRLVGEDSAKVEIEQEESKKR